MTDLTAIYAKELAFVTEYHNWFSQYSAAEKRLQGALDEYAAAPFSEAEYGAVYGYSDWDESCNAADPDEEFNTFIQKRVDSVELANPYWGSHVPYTEQTTLALKVGYFEGLLTNRYDSQRFNTSSYYRLGQLLGTMAAKGEIPHDSWKAIVWAVDDLTGFNRSLPLGRESLQIAKDIAAQINADKAAELQAA